MERFDELKDYCRMLGHHVPFKYCRTANNGIPCAKILDCNFERLPIQEFIDSNYTDEEMRQVRAKEQIKAAVVGEYAAQILLDHPSSSVKKNPPPTAAAGVSFGTKPSTGLPTATTYPLADDP